MLALGIVYISTCFVQSIIVLIVCDTCSIVRLFLSVVQNMVFWAYWTLTAHSCKSEHGFHNCSISWMILDYDVFLYCCAFLWGPGCVQCDAHVCHGGAHHVLLSVFVPQAVPWLPEGTCISHFVCMSWFGKSYLQSGLESFTDWVCWGEGAGGLVVNQTGSQRIRTAKENTRVRSDPSEICWSKLCPKLLVMFK